MQKKLKKERAALSVLLIISMLFSLVPAGVFADSLDNTDLNSIQDNVSAFADYPEDGKLVEEQDFPLSVYNVPEHESGSLYVKWDEPDNEYNWAYSYFQREAGEEDWEERSTRYEKKINVLNIYPREYNYLPTWFTNHSAKIPTDGNGEKLVNLQPVSQNNFNRDPGSYLKNADGSYKYDVIVIGFHDLNTESLASSDNGVSQAAIDAVEEFILSGRGVLFGHDSLFDIGHTADGALPVGNGTDSRITWRQENPGAPYFNTHGGHENVWVRGDWQYSQLAHYVGVIPGVHQDKTTAGNMSWTQRFGTEGTFVKVTNGGFLTTYPNKLQEGDILTVPNTHVNGIAVTGTVWMEFVKNRNGEEYPSDYYGSSGGSKNYIKHYQYGETAYRDGAYLSSYENTAHIQTGHSNGSATADEVAVLLNTMFHLAQLTDEKELYDSSAMDKEAPELVDARLVEYSDAGITLSLSAEDLGTEYEVMVKAIAQNANAHGKVTRNSNVMGQISATGTKGFLYKIDSSPIAGKSDLAAYNETGGRYEPAPASQNVTQQNSFTLDIDKVANAGKYLHILAYDHAGNVGEAASYAVDDFQPKLHVEITDENNSPVTGASIFAFGIETVTGQSGKETFLIDNTGSYNVTVFKPGYEAQQQTAVIEPGSMEVTLRFQLKKSEAGSIYGYVKDENDQPLANAKVGTLTGADAVTDQYGFYLIQALDAGKYTVTAKKSGYNTELGSAVVSQGDAVRLDFTLIKQTGGNSKYILTGQVTDEGSGSPLSGAEVSSGSALSYTDSFGYYAIKEFDKGQVLFDYKMAGYESKLRQPVTFDGDESLDIALKFMEGYGKVVITVKDNESGNVLPGAGVTVRSDSRTTDEYGRVEFTLPYGTYSLLAGASGYNVKTDSVTLSDQTYYVEKEMRLVKGSLGAIYGRVIDEETLEPVAGAQVTTALPAEDGGAVALSDDDGYYMLPDLTPGSYTVYVTKEGYEPKAANITVDVSEMKLHDFHIKPTAKTLYYIKGRITLETSGAVVEGAKVWDDAEPDANAAYTDSFGWYFLTGDGYKAGSSHVLQAEKGDLQSLKDTVTLQNGFGTCDLILLEKIEIVVTHIVEGETEPFTRFSVFTTRKADPVTLSSIKFPGYVLADNEETLRTVNLAEIDVDEESKYYVTFKYKSSMSQVTVQAVFDDGGNGTGNQLIPTVTPFKVPGEIGAYFSYDPIDVEGYVYSRSDSPIKVEGDGTSVFRLYYKKSSGNFNIKAVDKNSGTLIGLLEDTLENGQVYQVTDDKAPESDKIEALKYYTLAEGHYIGEPGTVSYEYKGFGDIPDAVYLYERNKTEVTVEIRDVEETTKVIASNSGSQLLIDRGSPHVVETSYAASLLPSGYALIDTADKVILPDENMEETTVVFYARDSRNTVHGTIYFRYIDDNGDQATITSTTVSGKAGDVIKAYPMEIRGWKLDPEEEEEKEMTLAADPSEGENEITFLYVQDTVKVKVKAVLDDDAETDITNLLDERVREMEVAKNTPLIIYAPGVSGHNPVAYALSDGEFKVGKTISLSADEVAEDLDVTFKYHEAAAWEGWVDVTVTGKDQDGGKLYSYETQQPENSTVTYTGLDWNGYSLENKTKDLTVGTEPEEVIFVYESLKTQVDIYLVDAQKQEPDNVISALEASAEMGSEFTYYAPVLEGWNFAGPQLSQTITVSADARQITFLYEKAAGNVVYEYRDKATGDIFMKETRVYSAGDTVDMEPSNLSHIFYTHVSTEPSGTVVYDGKPLTVTFVFEKQLGSVTIRQVDYQDEGLELSPPEEVEDLRLGEYYEAAAPASPEGYVLISPAVQNILVEGNGEAVFKYKAAASNAVKVVAKYGDTELQSYEVSGVPGEEIQVKAPNIAGYKLTDDDEYRTVVIEKGKVVVFQYDKDISTITLRFEKSDGIEIIPQNSVQTEFEAPNGQPYTVYAPHLTGYIPTGELSKTVDVPREGSGNISVTFTYMPMEWIVGEYMVKVMVYGRTGEDELYKYPRTYPLNSGEQSLEGFELDGYRLVNSPQTINVTDKENTPENVIFEYRSIGAEVTILLWDEETDSLLDSWTVEGRAGEPFTYMAPYYPGYYLTDASTIGKVDTVAANGSSEILFHYKPVNSSVTITAREKTEEGERTLKVVNVDTSGFISGNKVTLNIDKETDLAAEYYTYAGGEEDPAVSGKISFQYSSESGAQNFTVYYRKNLIEIPIRMIDVNSGEEIGSSKLAGQRQGEVAAVEAPAVEHYIAVGGSMKFAVAQPDEAVTFEYRSLKENEVLVQAVDKEGRNTIQEYTVSGVVGQSITVAAPSILGWKLDENDSEKTVTIASGSGSEIANTVIFEYTKDISEIKISYLDTAGNPVSGADILEAPNGADFTARAKHIEGYVISGKTEETLSVPRDGGDDLEVWFTYRHIVEEIPNYQVTIAVKGIVKDDPSRLPLYTHEKVYEKSPETITVTADDVEGYQLIGSGQRQVSLEDSAEVVFEYRSLKTGVNIYYVDSDGQDIMPPDFVDAQEGKEFVMHAPYVKSGEADGGKEYIYRGWSAGGDPEGLNPSTIAEIARVPASGAEITFVYEEAPDREGVVLLRLNDTDLGEVVRIVEGDVSYFEDGVEIELYEDDLQEILGSGISRQMEEAGYMMAASGLPVTFKYESDADKIQWIDVDYDKLKREVHLIALDEGGEIIERFEDLGAYRVMEAHAFTARELSEWVLTEDAEKYAVVKMDEGGTGEAFEVTFRYKAASDGGGNGGGGGGGGGSSSSKYTLTYYPNNGTKETEVKARSLEAGSSVTAKEGSIFTAPKAEDGGEKIFAGWASSQNGDVLYLGRQTFNMPNKDLKLYAVWGEGDAGVQADGIHYAYIAGYPDGTVRPNSDITREEAAVIFFRLMSEEERNKYKTDQNSFDDVESGRWSNTAVSTLANAGIIIGDEKGDFNPGAPITRAELAVIAVKFKGESTVVNNRFPDVVGHWGQAYVDKAASLNWIVGYPAAPGAASGTFRPDNNITRAELVTMTNKVEGRGASSAVDMLSDMKHYSDNKNAGAWFYLQIQEAANSHSYVMLENGSEKWVEILPDPDWSLLEKLEQYDLNAE